MADLSIIEFLVYGLIGYSGILVLIISVLTNPPSKVSLAGIRSVWLMPSIISLSILMFASGNITMEYTDSTNNVLGYNVTDGSLISNSTQTIQELNKFILVDPVWGLVHFSFFIILILYIIIQTLIILTKPND